LADRDAGFTVGRPDAPRGAVFTRVRGRAGAEGDAPERATGRETDTDFLAVLDFAAGAPRRLFPALVANRFLPPEFFVDFGLRDPTDRLEARAEGFFAIERFSPEAGEGAERQPDLSGAS